MKFHTIKWREMRSKNNSIEHEKESRTVNFMKLIFKEYDKVSDRIAITPPTVHSRLNPLKPLHNLSAKGSETKI